MISPFLKEMSYSCATQNQLIPFSPGLTFHTVFYSSLPSPLQCSMLSSHDKTIIFFFSLHLILQPTSSFFYRFLTSFPATLYQSFLSFHYLLPYLKFCDNFNVCTFPLEKISHCSLSLVPEHLHNNLPSAVTTIGLGTMPVRLPMPQPLKVCLEDTKRIRKADTQLFYPQLQKYLELLRSIDKHPLPP